MGQEALGESYLAQRSQYVALTNLALCVWGTSFLVWFVAHTPSSCTGTTDATAWNLPRPLAATPGSRSNSNTYLGGLRMTAQSAWEEQAIANLSDYRVSFLSLVRPHYGKHNWWSVFLPIISCPPERPLTRYGGTGDGSKLLCSVSSTSVLQETGCIIYSLGSNGDYAFERTMLDETRCKLHTFDCTYKAGTSQSPGRHFYHHWCLGEPHQGQQYRTWSNITASLGHKKVHLLKMDIEGYEHDVIPAWRPEDNLPDEVSMEIHADYVGSNPPNTTGELGLTFWHLANLGYAAYSQEINSIVPGCCAEFTFRRLGYHSG